MTRTVDDVLRDYAVIFKGRTRYDGQEPRDDELLVDEIERLRTLPLNDRERRLAELLFHARSALLREWIEAGSTAARAAYEATDPRTL